MDKIINIDCTLRDGGYYNKWDFSIEFINEYLRIMSLISIDYVEIGFRSLDDKFYKGPCAYSTEGLFEILEIPLGLQIGVMINADEAIAFEDGQEVFINKLFEDASSSAISLVRVAVNFKDVDKVSAIFNALKKRGYKTCINLMQIADRTSEELEFSIKYAKSYGVDVFYIADSFGSLFPETIARILKHIKIYWQGPIGIHAHDNLGRATSNTFSAIDDGASWVDSTLLGMGRGPGNAQTEFLFIEECIRSGQFHNLSELVKFIRNYMKPLMEKYQWGSSIHFYLAGRFGIHPNYVQELMGDPRYSDAEVIANIKALSIEGGKKFNKLFISDAASDDWFAAKEGWTAEKLLNGRPALVIGAGASVEKNIVAIKKFIKKYNPFVISLNHCYVDLEVDLEVFCSLGRIQADFPAIIKSGTKLVVPNKEVLEQSLGKWSGENVVTFPVDIQDGVFRFNQYSCTIPSLVAAAYGLAIANSGLCTKIYLAGWDGFDNDSEKNREISEILESYFSVEGAIPLVAITETSYLLPCKPVYSLI